MTDRQIIVWKLIEKFQKDEPRIVLYKHEKNIGLVTTRAHLGQYVKGKYLMWLAPDDAYCSPDAAKMVYEKAEITSADIIHFKILFDEPNGIPNGSSPKISGIMKQPQLSDAILIKKKNCQYSSYVEQTLY